MKYKTVQKYHADLRQDMDFPGFKAVALTYCTTSNIYIILLEEIENYVAPKEKKSFWKKFLTNK